MSKVTKVGLIGAGYIADWHADAIAATAGAELACVVDPNAAAAKAFGAARGIEAYGSVAEMLSAGTCEAVHILTPPDSHHAVAQECIAGGLHVLVHIC